MYTPGSQFQKYSPWRPLDWCWQRAAWLFDHARRFSRRRDDEATGRALRYLRECRRCLPGSESALERLDPDVHAACRLQTCGGPVKLVVEARILARQSSVEIAQLTGVPASVVDAYEAMFFHCRDRLEAVNWVLLRAIGRTRCEPSAARDTGTILKTFAYFGGPPVLDAVLPHLLGNPSAEPPDLSTPQGRLTLAARLLVSLERLSNQDLNWLKWLSLHVDRLVDDQETVSAATLTEIPAQNLDANLENLVAEALRGAANKAQAPPSHDRAPELRETA